MIVEHFKMQLWGENTTFEATTVVYTVGIIFITQLSILSSKHTAIEISDKTLKYGEKCTSAIATAVGLLPMHFFRALSLLLD